MKSALARATINKLQHNMTACRSKCALKKCVWSAVDSPLSRCFCEQRRGELVACKVFRGDVSPREENARQREFRVMTDLKHENIVKFIAVEQEVIQVTLNTQS